MDEITPYQLWASNLLRLSALLTAVAYFISPMETHFELVMVSVLIGIVIIIALAYFVRKGYEGPKWILLALLAINLPFSIMGVKDLLKAGLLAAVLSQLINLVQVGALILLFLPAKKGVAASISEETE